MGSFGIGAAVRRKEDKRFLTGKGTYTDDINRPGQLQAFLLRSPHAHAEIASIDTAKAKAAPGVVAVVVAETRAEAEAAAELVEIAYRDLAAVVAADEATRPGSPLLFDTAPG